MTWRRRSVAAKKPRPNFVPRGEFTGKNNDRVFAGTTLGPASPGRVLSPDERRVVEEKLRSEGRLQ
jgi:hypothetical protein